MVLILVLAGAGVAQGQPQGQQQNQIPVRDGYWWTNQAQDFKLGFVTGFAVAMTGNSDAAVVRCIATKPGGAEKASGEEWKACTQAPEVVMLSYSGLRTGQLVDGVDEFYKDFRNKSILVDTAMRYVKDELRGMTDKQLQDELATFRQSAK
jgi:hypothetical protein